MEAAHKQLVNEYTVTLTYWLKNLPKIDKENNRYVARASCLAEELKVVKKDFEQSKNDLFSVQVELSVLQIENLEKKHQRETLEKQLSDTKKIVARLKLEIAAKRVLYSVVISAIEEIMGADKEGLTKKVLAAEESLLVFMGDCRKLKEELANMLRREGQLKEDHAAAKRILEQGSKQLEEEHASKIIQIQEEHASIIFQIEEDHAGAIFQIEEQQKLAKAKIQIQDEDGITSKQFSEKRRRGSKLMCWK